MAFYNVSLEQMSFYAYFFLRKSRIKVPPNARTLEQGTSVVTALAPILGQEGRLGIRNAFLRRIRAKYQRGGAAVTKAEIGQNTAVDLICVASLSGQKEFYGTKAKIPHCLVIFALKQDTFLQTVRTGKSGLKRMPIISAFV